MHCNGQATRGNSSISSRSLSAPCFFSENLNSFNKFKVLGHPYISTVQGIHPHSGQQDCDSENMGDRERSVLLN